MNSAMVVALCCIAVAVICVNGQYAAYHPWCETDWDCMSNTDFTCTEPGDSPFCHSNECHCHQEEECHSNSDCFLECGPNATCDHGHCHGDCHHW